MLALNGKTDTQNGSPTTFFSAGTPLSYSRPVVYGHTPAVTLAPLAPGSHRFQAAGNGFENAAREIAQMRVKITSAPRCVAISG